MTTQSKPHGKKPTHTIYLVEGSGDEAVWTPIGAAWPNSDQKGFSINCERYPANGRIVMRATREKPRDQN